METIQKDRKLATIRRIAEVAPIAGADKIVAYRVDGWWVVDQKDRYQIGDLAVYLEVDSWVPFEVAPFLTKGKEPREFEGVKGERLKTIRLKGQLSQGLLLPLTHAFNGGDGCVLLNGEIVQEGDDVTDLLGVIKWEKPMSAQLAGMARGNFPSFIPKTDQERIQNLTRAFEMWKLGGELWQITEKLDGSSMTVYVNGESDGVCSRNLDLKFDEGNAFWEAALKYKLLEKIRSTGRNLALQGELVGEGIQGNSYKLDGRQFFLFDVYDIDRREYLLPIDVMTLATYLSIYHVPVLAFNWQIQSHMTVADILNQAEASSTIGIGPEREGLVFKSMTQPNVSFKSISDSWLLKYE